MCCCPTLQKTKDIYYKRVHDPKVGPVPLFGKRCTKRLSHQAACSLVWYLTLISQSIYITNISIVHLVSLPCHSSSSLSLSHWPGRHGHWCACGWWWRRGPILPSRSSAADSQSPEPSLHPSPVTAQQLCYPLTGTHPNMSEAVCVEYCIGCVVLFNGFHLFEHRVVGAVQVHLHQLVAGGKDEEGLHIWRKWDITFDLVYLKE